MTDLATDPRVLADPIDGVAWHLYKQSEASIGDACVQLVLRDGGGDHCGLPADAHPRKCRNCCAPDEDPRAWCDGHTAGEPPHKGVCSMKAHEPESWRCVTPARARMLAQHAIHVQGGYSDPDTEQERAELDIARRSAPYTWDLMQSELDEVLKAKVAQLPDGVAPPEVVTDVLPADDDAPPPADTPGIDVVLIRRYQALRAEEDRLTAEGKAMKEEADAIEGRLVDMFSEAGLQNLNVDGKTVYLNRTTFAQWQAGLEREDKHRLLRENGAEDLVTETVNGSTLNAWVREMVDEDDSEGLPEPLAEVLELGERFNIRIKAAGSRKPSRTRSK